MQLKSRYRAINCSLTFKIPQTFYQHHFTDIASALNNSVNAACTPTTSNVLLAGISSVLPLRYRISWSIIEFARAHVNRERDDEPRCVVAVHPT